MWVNPASMLSPVVATATNRRAATHHDVREGGGVGEGGGGTGPTPGFAAFFHGASGNFSGNFTDFGLGWAICNSGSTASAPGAGAVMLPFHEAIRACKPCFSAVCLSPDFM